MPLVFDLHCHSIASDGSLSPTELVNFAITQGVDVLALTDHDNTAGIAEAQGIADKRGLRLIPGVEISVSWGAITVHILGLGVEPECQVLQAGLSKLREFRIWRATEMDKRLAKHGINNALLGAKKYATGEIIGRTHFAHYLVEQGICKDFKSVFKKYLTNGKPGHVAGDWALLEDAIGWINAAGGQAVIAHPARYRLSATKLRNLIDDFKSHGGVGLEVVSGSHTRSDCQKMAKVANDFELLASCGSDFHGPEIAWTQLGKIPALPRSCVPVWQNWQL